jgi:phosphatidate phosphatase PAH1
MSGSLQVAIPDKRILIINPAGEIHNPFNNRELVDQMFPPVVEERDEPPPQEVSRASNTRVFL